jgi:hypothetical protein
MAEGTERPDDEQLAEGAELERVSAATRLFDVRRVIGGLFVGYGVIVTLRGIFDGKSEIAKAQGVRINLWMGLAMLVLGLLFLLWLRLNPPKTRDVRPAAAPDAGREAAPES